MLTYAKLLDRHRLTVRDGYLSYVSVSDEIWRDMQALKKQERKAKPRSLQDQLREHITQQNGTQPADAEDELLPTQDDDELDTINTSSSSTLVHRPSSPTSLSSSHAPPQFRPVGGPSVDAILRMRRTNRKVDADDVGNRFQKAMDYKRMRQEQKEAAEKGKAGQR